MKKEDIKEGVWYAFKRNSYSEAVKVKVVPNVDPKFNNTKYSWKKGEMCPFVTTECTPRGVLSRQIVCTWEQHLVLEKAAEAEAEQQRIRTEELRRKAKQFDDACVGTPFSRRGWDRDFQLAGTYDDLMGLLTLWKTNNPNPER